MAIETNFKIRNSANVETTLGVGTRVGIAQTDPQKSLHLGNTTPTIRFEDSGSSVVIDILETGNNLAVVVGSSNVMVINSVGVTLPGNVSVNHVIANSKVLVPNGSVSAPSITFSQDTNSGLYLLGLDNLGITTGGVLSIEFTESGGVVTTEFPNGPVIASSGIGTEKTGDFTFALGDRNITIPVNVGSSANATVPPESSVEFSNGTMLSILQTGNSQITWTAGTGVTLNTEDSSSLVTKGLYSLSFALKIGTNEWVVSGSLEAA